MWRRSCQPGELPRLSPAPDRPVAGQLWQVDQQINQIDGEMATLTAQRKSLWQLHVRLLVELGGATPTPLPTYAVGAPPVGRPATAAIAVLQPRREWTPRRVQNLLLTIGALLLVIATAIFTAVSWHRLGDGPQSLILTAVAAGCATLTRFLNRRSLTATAEAIGAICVGLVVFDADAAHKVLLPALTGRPYWAVATAALALTFAGLGHFTKARVVSIAAAAAALLPLLVLAFGANQPTADRALLLGLDALLAATALAGLRRSGAEGRTVSDVRICWIAGGSAAWVGGFTVPVAHLLYGLGGASLNVVLGGLVASGLAAAVTAWTVGEALLPYRIPARAPLAGASALTLICALVLPVQTHVDIAWWAAAVITASLLVLAGATQLPQTWRTGPQWTAVATAGIALSTELLSVTSTVAGQVGWYGQPWQSLSATVSGTAARAVALPQQFGGAGNLVALLVAAVMAVAAGWVLGRRTIGIVTGAALVSVTTLVCVPQLGGSYGTGLAVDGALTMVAALAAALLRHALLARTATVISLLAGTVTLGWALALPSTTAVAGCWLVATLVAAAAVTVPWREAWLATATIAGGYAAVGVAHQLGAPDHALGVVVGALAVAVAVTLRWFSPSRAADVLDACCGVLVFAGLDLNGGDSGWLSWTMLVAATWAGALCLRQDRRAAAPLAAVAGLIALTVLPAAQHLPLGWTVALWVALVAVAVSGSLAAVLLGGEPSRAHRATAAVLAVGAVPLALLALGVAAVTNSGLTACLSALCLVFAAVVCLPDGLFADRSVGLAWRSAATAATTGLLLGACGSAAADAGLTAGNSAIAVAIVAGAIAIVSGLLSRLRKDIVVAELVSAAGLGVALLIAKEDATSAGWVLAVGGLSVLLTATTPARRQLWPAGVGLLAAASWVWLRHAGIASPEPYTDPVAAVALVAGYLRRRTVPTTASFSAYGAGLVGLLVPSLLWSLVDSGVERPLLLAALATAVVIIGAQQGLRAPLIVGGGTLVLTALRLMAPYETMIPRWVEVGTAGTLLLMLGATYEQRRRDMQLLRARYDALL